MGGRLEGGVGGEGRAGVGVSVGLVLLVTDLDDR